MAIVINGSGTITGLSAGGLPTGSVTADTLATDSVDSAELVNGAIVNADINASAAIDVSKLSTTRQVTAPRSRLILTQRCLTKGQTSPLILSRPLLLVNIFLQLI